MAVEASLEALLRRDRALTLAGLGALAVLAWLYLVHLDREMRVHADMGMASVALWDVADAGLALAMWGVMMVAMMLPATAPMVLTFTTINRKRREAGGAPHVATGIFVTGYLVVWGAFSVLAVAAQWSLQAAALLNVSTLRVTPFVGAAVVAGAGVWQLTPLKYACLARCQSPLGFLMTEWRDGPRGTLVMGLRHGLFCLGCCWVLMALLFVGGVMNLAWIAALTAFVLVEKLAPAGRSVSRASGIVLLAWAAWLTGRAL